jgi:hypothetical protein
MFRICNVRFSTLKLFDNVSQPCDGGEIQDYYQQVQNK